MSADAIFNVTAALSARLQSALTAAGTGISCRWASD